MHVVDNYVHRYNAGVAQGKGMPVKKGFTCALFLVGLK